MFLVTRIPDLDQQQPVKDDPTAFFEPWVRIAYRVINAASETQPETPTETRSFPLDSVFKKVEDRDAGANRYYLWKPKPDFQQSDVWGRIEKLDVHWRYDPGGDDKVVVLSPWRLSGGGTGDDFDGVDARLLDTSMGAQVAVVVTKTSSAAFADETCLFGPANDAAKAKPTLQFQGGGLNQTVTFKLVLDENAESIAKLPPVSADETRRAHVLKTLPNGEVIAGRRNIV
jgi:hypothetical protein